MLKFVRPYYTGVLATFGNHYLASEILTRFGGQNVASHWIEASYVVISAALAYHKHAGTIEANRSIGQTLT
jgi:ABC-type Fe3+-hydroxamate transport system substrate-binding protein